MLTVIRRSKCFARLQRQLPLGHLPADILLLVLSHQPIAEVADVHLLPIHRTRPRLDVRFDVVQQFFDEDLMGGEFHFRAVAEAKFDRGAPAGRLRHHGLEAAPIVHDLLQGRLDRVAADLVRGRNHFQQATPIVGRLGILPPVLEFRRQALKCLSTGFGLRVGGHLLVDLDEIEFVRQLKSLDPGGQPSDGFIFAQGMQRVGAAFILLAVVGPDTTESPAGVADRLDAKLCAQEVGKLQPRLVGALRIELGGLSEAPAPALAVVLRGRETLGDAIEHWLAVGIDRRALAPPRKPQRP